MGQFSPTGDRLEYTQVDCWIPLKEIFQLCFLGGGGGREPFSWKALCLPFIFSTILTKPVCARLLGTKTTISFQDCRVCPMCFGDGVGSGISLHLCNHDVYWLKVGS